ncbi:hypothetical protein MTO96_035300 [Rhipicephalus appendiculatus]
MLIITNIGNQRKTAMIERSFPPLGQPQQQEQTSRSSFRSRRKSRSRSRSKSRSRSRSRSRSASHLNSSSSTLPCSPESSQGSSQSSSTPGPKKLAWAQGPPASLKASPTSSPETQVRELVRENSSLKAQLSSEESQISTLMSQIGHLTQCIQSLEAKLDRTLTQPPATASQPMEETDIAVAVSKAVSAALTTLDAKFEARFNPLQQAIADTNSSLNALKSYTEATNTSLNALKNYTETTTAEIHARLEHRQRSPAFGQPATAQEGLKPATA